MTRYFNRRVLRLALPIIIAYFCLGLPCGVLAQNAGLSPLLALLFSVIGYSGSGQYIGLALIGESVSYVTIALTTIIVHLRYLFFSTSLLPHYQQCSAPKLALLAHGVVDECFAINLSAFEREPGFTTDEAVGINEICMASWASANFLGCYAAGLIGLPEGLVSYLLIAMFIGIWSGYMDKPRLVVTGTLSGLLAIVLSLVLPYKLHIVVATLVVSGAMCYLGRRVTPTPAAAEAVTTTTTGTTAPATVPSAQADGKGGERHD